MSQANVFRISQHICNTVCQGLFKHCIYTKLHNQEICHIFFPPFMHEGIRTQKGQNWESLHVCCEILAL